MNDAQLQDLKQFIVATVSQATSTMATKDDISQLRHRLSGQISDLDLKIDTIAETLQDQLNTHELRLLTLENRR